MQRVWGLGRSGEIGLVDIVVQMFCRNPGDAVTLVALRLVAAPVRPSAMGTRLSPAQTRSPCLLAWASGSELPSDWVRLACLHFPRS